MARLIRGWKKDEFSAPANTWFIKLEGKYFDKSKGKHVKLSGAAVKLTYLFLVHCLDVYGGVFPSYETIAKYTEQSVKTVQRCVAYLEQIGLIYKINRFSDEGLRKSNEYIIYHPAQIPNLPTVEDTESKRLEDETDRLDSETKPENKAESDEPSISGMDSETKRLEAAANNIVCMSVSKFVGMSDPRPDHGNQTEQSEQTDREQIREYWKTAFNVYPSTIELDEIMSFGLSCEKVKEIIRKVALYVPIQTTPFRVVTHALAAEANGKPWQFHTDAGETKPNRKPKANGRADREKADKLPRAIAEAEKVGEEQPAAEVDEEERQKAVREKLAMMRAKLKQRTNAQTP